MGRKKEEVGVSFFAFQDIITAVTGIMFLVVLLIILLLFEKKVTETVVDTVDAEKIKAAESQIKTLTAQIESNQLINQVNEAFKNMTQEEISDQLDLTKQMIKFSNQQLEKSEKEKGKSQQQKINAKKVLKMIQDKSLETQEEIKNIQKKIANSKLEYEKFKKELEKKKNQISIAIAGTSNKKPILVECNEKMIRVKQHTSNAIKTYKNSAEFIKSLSSVSADQYFFLLLIKPDAFPYANKLQFELKTKGYERGIEVLPDNKTEIF